MRRMLMGAVIALVGCGESVVGVEPFDPWTLRDVCRPESHEGCPDIEQRTGVGTGEPITIPTSGTAMLLWESIPTRPGNSDLWFVHHGGTIADGVITIDPPKDWWYHVFVFDQ